MTRHTFSGVERLSLAFLLAAFVAACGSSGGDSSNDGGGGARPTPAPTAEPTAAPQPTETPAPAGPPALRLTEIASGLSQPLYAVSPPDDPRLFILEQAGAVRVLVDGALRDEPFLDLTDIVGCCGERGLLGIAFLPDYESSGRFVVNYTNAEGDTVIAEYARSEDDPDRAAPDEVHRFLVIEQPFGNHNGGMVVFGPDGMLYVGLGDGGAAADPLDSGQNSQTKLGAMLRIDVDTHPEPPDGNLAGADPDVWAIGLRNPWRYSFDRMTGDLYIADVGQNLFEEVHVAAAGAGSGNYGWNIMEGFHCFDPVEDCDMSGLLLPAVEYGRDLGCSVTGGYVYRGDAVAGLDGWYLYGDFCSNRVWAMRWEAGEVLEHHEITDDLDPDGIIGGLASFGEDADGEMYVVSIDGSVYRVDSE
ncbi:MAG: PQQ-dependent sugar dehydrogenase [Candidatus Binatia bacterium]|nr:PQQ-dependent sugar dehydrogenase [Candidatus Binatia bacterium]